MALHPPKHLLEVLQKLEYEDALKPGDPRYVETQEARGSEKTFSVLAKKFGWNPTSNDSFLPNQRHVLFFGHIGSGKTTELRRYMGSFDASRRFFVVEVDVLVKLDRNNLQYTEVLMAMAESLLEGLQGEGFGIGQGALEPLHAWFSTVVRSRSESNEFSAEVKAGVQASASIPGLVKLLASFTTAFKHNSSSKDEWRLEIRNRYTALVAAFNGVIRAAEEALKAAGRAERVLFLVDGTDKMRDADTDSFFVRNAEQLHAIQTLVIYTAPLYLKYDGRIGGKLDAETVLPMIKLHDEKNLRWQPGWTALHDMILRRIDRSLFAPGSAGEAQIERLVEMSGGHPRELLRLLRLCCELGDERIDDAVVESTIAKLASDYRRFLKPDDYALLVEIDSAPVHGGNDARAQDLLHRLALLEYNDGRWRRSHPVVRTLEGYKQAWNRPRPGPAN